MIIRRAKGNIDVARIHAESAIRNKNQSLQFLRLAAQIEGVSSKLKAQEVRAQVTEQLGGVTEALDTALGNMDMGEISRIMEKYGDQVEGLDVTTRFMDQELGDSAASTTPQGEVDDLLDRIAYVSSIPTVTPQTHIACTVFAVSPSYLIFFLCYYCFLFRPCLCCESHEICLSQSRERPRCSRSAQPHGSIPSAEYQCCGRRYGCTIRSVVWKSGPSVVFVFQVVFGCFSDVVASGSCVLIAVHVASLFP